MRRNLAFYLSFFVAPLLLCGVTTRAEGASASVRQSDPRLEKTISIRAKHICFGELVERLSQQSGVALTVGEADHAGDVEVAISFQHVPLADAMDALWSLVSYQNARWRWDRSGDAGRYRYKLVQTDAARGLAASIQKQIQEEFESQARKLQAALTMTPDQLKAAAQGDRMLQSFAANEDPRVRPSMTVFSQLPPEAQTQILHDHKGITLPVSQLSLEGQEFVRQQWLWTRGHGGMTKDGAGNLIPVPEPQSISICGYREDGDLAPWLTVDTGFGSGDIGDGWLEDRWHHKIEALWLLPGDTEDDGQSAKIVATQKSAGNSGMVFPFAGHLLQLADAAALPLIARLPHGGDLQGDVAAISPAGQTVRAYLNHLHDRNVPHKWRGGVLLVSQTAWLTQSGEETAPPWSLVKRLRDNEARQGGCLSLDDLANAAGTLSATQIRSLAAYFPVMNEIAGWQDLLAEYDGSPSLKASYASASGSDWIKAVRAAAEILGPQAQQRVQDGTATHVRMTDTRHDDGGNSTCEIDLQLLSDGGRIEARGGLTYASHQWHSGALAEPTDTPLP